MICGPHVRLSQRWDTSSGPDCPEAWRLLRFWARGVECAADDDTNPPIPPLALDKGASSSCPVVVRFSVLFCITWGGDNPAMVGSSSGWDRQGCQGPETWTRCWKGEWKKRQTEGKEKQRSCRKLIHSAKNSSLFCLIPPPSSHSSHYLTLFLPSLPSCFASLPFAVLLSCKLKLVSTELLILVSVY